MRARRVDGLAWLLLLASLLTGAQARAYCRTSTCDDCPRDDDGCTVGGEPIAWPGRCVAFGVHEGASEQVDFATVEMLTEQAFDTWNAVRCPPDDLPPSIELRGTDGPIVCGRSEYVGDAANANVLVFRDDAWPYEGEDDDLATTTVRSHPDGEIVDADMEINATRPLLVGEMEGQGTIFGAHDLLSIISHEMGHVLGLDHSQDPDSIMQVELPPRVVRTTLGDDDIAALCAAYPPERDAPPCEETPQGDFSAQCALDPSTGGACSTAYPGAGAPGRHTGLPGVLPALLITAAIWLRRRARASCPAAQSRSLPRNPCFQSRR